MGRPLRSLPPNHPAETELLSLLFCLGHCQSCSHMLNRKFKRLRSDGGAEYSGITYSGVDCDLHNDVRILKNWKNTFTGDRRLKRMTSWERKRWLAEHWSSFQILKEDGLSRQFQDRMQEFFCSGDHPRPIADDTVLLPGSPSTEQMDERQICKTSPPTRLLCRQRFILTWMSPVSSFGPRERLSLESIFKWHPHACVVILSRTLDSMPGTQLAIQIP